MDYSAIVRRAWAIFSRHRALWVLGMLAALSGQGEYGLNSNYSQSTNLQSGSGDTPDFPPFLRDFFANPVPLLAGTIGFSLLLGIVLFVIGSWLYAGLIHMTAQAEREQPTSLGESLAFARERFVRFALLKLLIQIPNFIVVIIVLAIMIPLVLSLLPTITDPTSASSINPETLIPLIFGSLACLIPLFILVFVYGLAISLLDDLAYRFCVLEGSRPWQSLRQAWKMFTSNLGYTVITWFLIGGVNFLFGLIAAVPAFAMLFPISGAVLERGFDATVFGGFALLFVYSLAVTVLAGGILTSFNATLWTVLFRQFQANAEGAASVVAPVLPSPPGPLSQG